MSVRDESDQGLPFYLNDRASDYRIMPPGGADPNHHWGARYRRVRDDLMERFLAEGHDPQVWRVHLSGGEGEANVAFVRCGRCDHRTRVHRFPISWARHRPRVCEPVSVQAHVARIEAKKQAEQGGWLWFGAIASAVWAGFFLFFTIANDRSWQSGIGLMAIVASALTLVFLVGALRSSWKRRRHAARE